MSTISNNTQHVKKFLDGLKKILDGFKKFLDGFLKKWRVKLKIGRKFEKYNKCKLS